MNLPAQKAQLRRAFTGLGAELEPSERERLSGAARELLLDQAVWREAGAVVLYAPLPGEVDVWPLADKALRQGKRVALPWYDRRRDGYVPRLVKDLEGELRPGRYGIPEPADRCPILQTNPLDLILVPGVAFDCRGRRLGRGKGYYDRMLRDTAGIKCGVAFDQQVVPAVPVAPHDIHLNCMLTPTRWLVFERSVLE